MEIWKSVPDYEGLYEVSNNGRLKRLKSRVRTGFGVKTLNERIVKPTYVDGYLRVNLWRKNKYKQFQVHRLVLFVFIGPSPLSVDHINGIRDDNRIENLEYVTLAENTRRQHRDGRMTFVTGERNGKSKLKNEAVYRIKNDLRTGMKCSAIAEREGVSLGAIRAIKSGRTWRD